MSEYNVYCDESCYLKNDLYDVMGFGCVCVPKDQVRSMSISQKAIKQRYYCKSELKWTKVSPKNKNFYISLVDSFFDNEKSSFRALVVEQKSLLDHEKYNSGSHDNFYYKMYFDLLKNIVDRKQCDDTFNFYFDIKDTHCSQKIKKLQEVLSNYLHDFSGEIIKNFQIVRSNESEMIQLTDFLLGAVMYKSRKLDTSSAKKEIASYIEKKSGYHLEVTNKPWNSKFNLFHFTPQSTKVG